MNQASSPERARSQSQMTFLVSRKGNGCMFWCCPVLSQPHGDSSAFTLLRSQSSSSLTSAVIPLYLLLLLIPPFSGFRPTRTVWELTSTHSDPPGLPLRSMSSWCYLLPALPALPVLSASAQTQRMPLPSHPLLPVSPLISPRSMRSSVVLSVGSKVTMWKGERRTW